MGADARASASDRGRGFFRYLVCTSVGAEAAFEVGFAGRLAPIDRPTLSAGLCGEATTIRDEAAPIDATMRHTPIKATTKRANDVAGRRVGFSGASEIRAVFLGAF